MPPIQDRLSYMQQQITGACQQYNRNINDVKLLAVSKTQSINKIRAANLAGQVSFGENYVQEALEKIDAMQDCDIEWHFIGHIQSNKTRAIATHFAWVHTLCDIKIAKRLNQQRPAELPPLNVCLQINIGDEASKQGIPCEAAVALAKAVSELPNLRLRGLMSIPSASLSLAEKRKPHAKLHKLLQDLNRTLGYSLDTLSMGMSGDFVAAIAEGATIVRIGTAIFGSRA